MDLDHFNMIPSVRRLAQSTSIISIRLINLHMFAPRGLSGSTGITDSGPQNAFGSSKQGITAPVATHSESGLFEGSVHMVQ